LVGREVMDNKIIWEDTHPLPLIFFELIFTAGVLGAMVFNWVIKFYPTIQLPWSTHTRLATFILFCAFMLASRFLWRLIMRQEIVQIDLQGLRIPFKAKGISINHWLPWEKIHSIYIKERPFMGTYFAHINFQYDGELPMFPRLISTIVYRHMTPHAFKRFLIHDKQEFVKVLEGLGKAELVHQCKSLTQALEK
jgi:hypothetical protein